MKKLMAAILLAGFCGGMVEIAWVAIYSSMTQVSGAEVARQITASVFPFLAHSPWALPLGLAVHLALSLLLGCIFGVAVWVPFAHRLQFSQLMLAAAAALVAVWALNFFVILPVLNPAFVTLMPYGVTLFSKLAFGAAMGWVLQGADVPKPGRRISRGRGFITASGLFEPGPRLSGQAMSAPRRMI